MKYHYKSPEEVQQAVREKHSKQSGPYRSRTFWIILIDIAIIVIVIGILYYSGLLTPQATSSRTTERFDGFEFSVSLIELRSDRPDVSLYLNVKNTGTEARTFPPPDGEDPAALREIKTVFFAGESFLHGHSLERPDLPNSFFNDTATTEIFSLPVVFPLEKRRGYYSFVTRLHLVLTGTILTLELPGVLVTTPKAAN